MLAWLIRGEDPTVVPLCAAAERSWGRTHSQASGSGTNAETSTALSLLGGIWDVHLHSTQKAQITVGPPTRGPSWMEKQISNSGIDFFPLPLFLFFFLKTVSSMSVENDFPFIVSEVDKSPNA